jgi:dolichol-phosphate mannosyltransferase
MKNRILLFIPAYNCASQIPRVLKQLDGNVGTLITEVIVVNNRSTDDTEAAARAAIVASGMKAKILRNDDNYGLGGSHKVAFNYARENGFDYCIVLHGDDQGSIRDLVPRLEAGQHLGVDCLLGARFMRGSRLKGYSPFRTFGNHVFNLIYSAASGRMIEDLGSGLNLYNVSKLDDAFYLRCANDLTFNYHMLLRSIQAGWRIQYFPIEWREDDQLSNVKLVRQALRVLGIALRYAFNRNGYLASDYAHPYREHYPSTVVFNSTDAREQV